MLSKTSLSILAALCMLFSGCASEEPTDTTETPEDPATGDGNETVDPGAGIDGDGDDGGDDGDADDSDVVENTTNTAPVASLEASAINGTAPLNVTFTLDGTDADGDDLTWTLTIDGEDVETGDALPADVTHRFEAGSHNVTFNVTDGEAYDAITQEITAVEEAVAVYAETFTAEVSLACPQCQEVGAMASASWNTGEGGVDAVYFELPAEAAGHPFTTHEGTDLDSDVEFFTECASDAESLGLFTSIDAHEEGTVPDGAGCAVLWIWYPTGPVDVTLDVL